MVRFNQYRRLSKAISKLANTHSRLAHLVVQKDQASIKREFEKSYGVFRARAARALKESDMIIDYLSILLAANEVEQV